MLSCNFRSGGAVLSGVNDVFRNCMTPKVGGLVYSKDEELNEGLPHTPLGEPEVELWAVDVQESTYDEEAEFVANRIAELTDGTHFVREGKDLRPIRVDDVAILLRSTASMGEYYKDALARLGIACNTGGGEDLLKTDEVAVLRSLLQTISNPRQDIPLLATLISPVFCVTAEEMAVIRGKNRNVSIYDALLNTDNEKIRRFLQMLTNWRKEARLQPLAQLLESIFAETRIDSIYASMTDGGLRRDNLHVFYQMAVDYEKTGRRDLEQFLDHLDALEKKGLSAESGSASNAVTLMTIHKSKGLEFPVVFVCGLSRIFSRESVKGQVLCDQTLGLGLAAVDEKNRVRYPTIAKRAISAKILADGLSEEMRVLYVALTRARDRLIMTYASRTLQKDLAELALRMDVGDPELLIQDVVCPGEWVLMTALRRTEAGEFFALSECNVKSAPGEVPWLIRVATSPQYTGKVTECEAEEEPLTAEFLTQLQEGLAYQYAHTAATTAPSKQTATQRKGREKDAEATEHAPEQRMTYRKWRRPSFVEQTVDATTVGTATHAVMQYIRYDQCVDAAHIRHEIDRLQEENFISPNQAELVDCEQIAGFFQTEIGIKLRNHPNVLREFKFTVLDDAGRYDPALVGEEILLQGVVDCAMVDEDGITVIDFKTDYVTEETLPEKVQQYRPQVQAYGDAMSRIYKKNVKESWLYFFRLNRFVKI